jgi:hypothetical protein
MGEVLRVNNSKCTIRTSESYRTVIIQGTYKLSEYFAKLDDRCILCNEIVHITFGSTSQEDYDVQIAVGTRVEPPQIPGHTNYARSVRQSFPSNTGLRFSREMAVATIG